jgi:hypothetical protein
MKFTRVADRVEGLIEAARRVVGQTASGKGYFRP